MTCMQKRSAWVLSPLSWIQLIQAYIPLIALFPRCSWHMPPSVCLSVVKYKCVLFLFQEKELAGHWVCWGKKMEEPTWILILELSNSHVCLFNNMSSSLRVSSEGSPVAPSVGQHKTCWRLKWVILWVGSFRDLGALQLYGQHYKSYLVGCFCQSNCTRAEVLCYI